MFTHCIGPELELRLLLPHHAEALFALVDANRAYTREWLPWLDANRELADIQKFIDDSLLRFAETSEFVAGIWWEGRLAGAIDLHRIERKNRLAYIGYWLAQDLQGRGIMTRCCRALMAHAFRELELNRIVITCARGNHRSQAIPERLGFTREGILREAEWLHDHFVDLYVYGLLRSEWQPDAELQL